MSNTIEIENIGAVKTLRMEIPPEGGLLVLQGGQGVGKSTTLRAIDSVLQGNGSLDKRDGSIEGKISAFGVTISVKKSTRRTGELEVESLSGRLSLDELIDPGLADPTAADAKRIKALVQLAGAQADPTIFYELVGGEAEFKRIVGDQSKESDLLKLAGVVKRKIQEAAREVESAADKAAGSARAFRESASKVEETEAIDPAKLQADLESAIANESALKQAAKSGAELVKNAAEAREQSAKAEASYEGKSVEDATKDHDAEVIKVREAEAKVDELLKQLQAAESAVEEAKRAEFQSRIKVDQAKNHFRSLESWRQLVAGAESLNVPDEATIAQATQKVAEARAAIETQALVRKAIDDRASAEQADMQYHSLASRATNLREAAAKVDDKLSEVVGKLDCPLRVRDSRLTIETDRGQELFSDLSTGERIMVAVPIAAAYLPRDGILTISQSFYGEIQPANRRLLHETLKKNGVTALTAEATDDPELCASVFDE